MEKTLRYRDRLINYQVDGNGSPVLLLHGFGEDHKVWKEQVAFLEKEFRFIVPDLPGSGKSEAITDMSMEGLADAMKSIIDFELQDEPGQTLALIGHSMGGYIALAFLEKYPLLLNSLGLFHSTAYADTEEKKQARRKGIEFIRVNGALEFLKTSIPNLFSPHSRQKMAPAIKDFIESQHNFKAESIVSYYEAMMARPDRRHLLENNQIPFLFVMGKYDTAVPLEDSLQQCHLPEKSYIHILGRSGHMGMMEETKESNQLMKNFLSQVLSRA